MADYWRQLDIVPMERLQALHVNIVGAGGIGSPTALALAKMGIGTLALWDDDVVEEHNLPNQFHKTNEIGQSKVGALSILLSEFVTKEECDIKPINARIDNKTKLDGIVAVGVDSMASRKAIWEATKVSPGVELYIDARMGGELLRLYTFNPHDPLAGKAYEATLYNDKEALHLPCTAQSIIYTGMMAGALIANSVKRYAANEKAANEVIFDLASYTLLTREF